MTYGIPVGIGLLALFFIVGLLRSMYKVAEPNEALIISGFGAGKKGSDLDFKSVAGGGTFVIPGLQIVRKLSLEARTAKLVTSCVSKQGIGVSIEGVCMYKIGDSAQSIANAARRFLGQPDDLIDSNIQTVLDGHLRSIISNLTIEEILQNREKLTGETRSAADDELAQMGLVINSLQIISIKDSSNYVASMAAPHVAEVQKNARIAQAAAEQAATIAEQEAAAQKAAATRDSEVKQAAYLAEIESAKATAAQQGPLAAAKAQQAVMVEQTKMTELEANRKEQELQVSVRRPADAEAYAVTVKANAQKVATIAAAEANAQQTKLEAESRAAAARVLGEGEAEATKARGAGEAAAIEAKGLAEGKAIQARVLAEAEGIAASGKAFAENKESVIQKILAEHMPEIVKEAAQPFAAIKNFMVLDGAQGVNRTLTGIIGVGATLLPQIMQTFKDGAEVVKNQVSLTNSGTDSEKPKK